MPIYEFQCKKCNHVQETILKYTELKEFLSTTKCLKCGKKTLKQIISAANFDLKGNDYYKPGFSGTKK